MSLSLALLSELVRGAQGRDACGARKGVSTLVACGGPEAPREEALRGHRGLSWGRPPDAALSDA
jgi:hypothetical protein